MSKRDHSGYVYVLESELCIKIGISNDPHTRIYNINKQCRDVGVPTFSIAYYKFFGNTINTMPLEKRLHNKYKDFRYTDLPVNIFGYTEMFDKSIMESVISDLENESYLSYAVTDYDPFLHLEGFRFYKQEIFDIVFNDLIKPEDWGISKSSIRSYKKLDINNLCANIKLAKSLGYDKLHMTPMVDRMTSTDFARKARKLLPLGCFDLHTECFSRIVEVCKDDKFVVRIASGLRGKIEKQEQMNLLNKTKFLSLPSMSLEVVPNKYNRLLYSYRDAYLSSTHNCLIT